jgi:hypothetical protein
MADLQPNSLNDQMIWLNSELDLFSPYAPSRGIEGQIWLIEI